jgi:hypothetical protein
MLSWLGLLLASGMGLLVLAVVCTAGLLSQLTAATVAGAAAVAAAAAAAALVCIYWSRTQQLSYTLWLPSQSLLLVTYAQLLCRIGSGEGQPYVQHTV